MQLARSLGPNNFSDGSNEVQPGTQPNIDNSEKAVVDQSDSIQVNNAES